MSDGRQVCAVYRVQLLRCGYLDTSCEMHRAPRSLRWRVRNNSWHDLLASDCSNQHARSEKNATFEVKYLMSRVVSYSTKLTPAFYRLKRSHYANLQ